MSRPSRQSRWVRVDRRYRNPWRLTGYAYRVMFKWFGLVIALIIANGVLAGLHVGFLILFTTGGLVWYAVHRLRVDYRRRHPVTGPTAPSVIGTVMPRFKLNPPPGWPQDVPAGWIPPPGWQPNPAWPPAPPGWQLWVPDTQAPMGERNSRYIPQDVRIAVAARDGGRCRMPGCGSTDDLHYDHVIPWSKGGANTVNNIQLLCGYHNRLKGADNIPA